MKLPKTIEKLCMPAKVYLFLTVISTLMYVGMMVNAEQEKHPEANIDVHAYTLAGLFFKLAFAVVWVVFLNYLCSKGHQGWAWFFLVMPIILMTFFIILTTFAVAYVTGGMAAHGQKIQALTGNHAQLRDTVQTHPAPLAPPTHLEPPATNHLNPFSAQEGFTGLDGIDVDLEPYSPF